MSDQKPRSGVVRCVRGVFESRNEAMRLGQLREALPDFKAAQLSMALCSLLKQGHVTRTQVENKRFREPKKVWLYTYTPRSKQQQEAQ
jgi:hypothetical protein